MKTEVSVLILLMVVMLASCTPAAEVVPLKTSLPVSSLTPAPPPPATKPSQPLATPTAFQLPVNESNYEGEYCQYPLVTLSALDAQGFSDDEIVEKLMDLHLTYFSASQAPAWCRIDGYTIDKISYDERTSYSSLEPQSDLMRVVQYSIKLIQVPNMWMSLPGEVDQQNWLHTAADVAIVHLDGYSLHFAHP